MIENLIVGSGIAGASLARLLADADQSARVIDRRAEIGGNCADGFRRGMYFQKYGPHIFHTNSAKVWNFLSRFTDWLPEQHKVAAMVDGQLVPIPFNLNSLRILFPVSMADRMTASLLEKFEYGANISFAQLQAADKFLAGFIYEKVFRGYSAKQWGALPDAAAMVRVPAFRLSRDDRYFQDKYQGIPADGYSAMFRKMLKHKNIQIRLNTEFSRDMKYKRLFYTGSIDEFFNYKFGRLSYRSIRFEFGKSAGQGRAVVNWPCNYDWTRITEYGYFLGGGGIASREIPCDFIPGKNEPFYPVAKKESRALYEKYIALAPAECPHVRFLGRLGTYKYLDMDDAIEEAFGVCDELPKQ